MRRLNKFLLAFLPAFLLHNAFFFRMRNLKIEYINFLILNQNVQNNITYLSMVFSMKENFLIKILSYVFSFLKLDYILQTLYKKFFIFLKLKAIS